jgi:hypothetical protein
VKFISVMSGGHEVLVPLDSIALVTEVDGDPDSCDIYFKLNCASKIEVRPNTFGDIYSITVPMCPRALGELIKVASR